MSPQGHTGGGGHRFQLRTPEWPWVFVPVAQGPGYEEALHPEQHPPPQSPAPEPSLHRKDSGQGRGDPGPGLWLQRRGGQWEAAGFGRSVSLLGPHRHRALWLAHCAELHLPLQVGIREAQGHSLLPFPLPALCQLPPGRPARFPSGSPGQSIQV